MAHSHKSRKSIAVTPTGKGKLREAQILKSGKRITYEDIEEMLEWTVSRSTIERFFRGKAVDIENAISITGALGLKLEEVVDVVSYEEIMLR
ncbi:MAG: helix-turn-helix domain-containing protein [Crocosphaera sp.]